MASLLKNSLIHWKKKLERTSDEDIILTTFHKLTKVPITLELLQDTGIGKIIRSLAKKDGKVGYKASSILKNWRDVVASEPEIPFSPPTEKERKSNSHKREVSNGEKVHDEKHRKQSSSSHESSSSREKVHNEKHHKQSQEKHKKSVSSRKEKHTNNGSEYTSVNSSTFIDKDAANLFRPDCIKKERESTLDFNSGNHINGDVNEYKKSSHSKESRKASESRPLQNGAADEKKHKNELVSKSTLDNIPSEKTLKKGFSSPIENYDRKRKSETPLDSNGVSKEKKHKHETSRSSDSNSSPVESKLVNGGEYKKRDKDKKSSKYSDHKVSVNSETEKEPLAKVKRDKESKKKSGSKQKTSIKIEPTEAFTASEVRFEDCLGFNDVVLVKKKKKTSKSTPEKKEKSVPPQKDNTTVHKKHHSSSKTKHNKVKTESPDLPDLLLEPAPALNEVDILSTLPQTQPTYRPLPQRNYDCITPKQKKVLSNEEAIKFTSSRREKTSVYSGRKNIFYTEVPTLLDSCIRVLIENIDAIESMGGVVPYYIIKQVLLRCSAQQLYNIEDYNPYLLEDTQELWEIHCKRDFRNQKPQENETWRDLYWSASEDLKKKLRNVTAHISASMDKYKPVRQVKMAYVDTFVKPPREVARKQAKHGTALPVNHPIKAGPPSKATPRPVAPVINSAASSSRESSSSREFVPKKPKVAPLMAKTLKSMKQCFRR